MECCRGSPAGGEFLYKVVFQYRFTVRLVHVMWSVQGSCIYSSRRGEQQADELTAEALKLYQAHQGQPGR